MSWVFIGGLLLLGTAADARAEDANEELRREVRELRGQVQSLRLVMSQLAELDRQRAMLLSRALENPGGADDLVPVVVSQPAQKRKADVLEVSERSETPAPAPALRSNGGGGGGGSARVTGKVVVPEGEPVAYVYVEDLQEPPVRGKSVLIEQARKQFTPQWAVIQRGTTIAFPNRDNIYHNVFSRSPGNTFDLGLYNSEGEAKRHTFTGPGPVDVYCNIHPRMSASVLVVPNRHFVKVSQDGSFTLDGVPAGKRKISAWAPGAVLSTTMVELQAGQTAQVKFALEAKSQGHKNKFGGAYGSY